MKTYHLIIMAILLMASHHIFAQNRQDTLGIKKACMDYIEGYYQSDAERVEKAIHPELTKRVIRKGKEGNELISHTGYSTLIYITKVNENQNVLNPEAPFKAQVDIYDIQSGIASAKVSSNKYPFFDYLHLGKFEGQWKIFNGMWQMKQ